MFKGGMGGIHTDVDSQATNGWEEHLDVRSSNEFGVHATSVFEQRPTQ